MGRKFRQDKTGRTFTNISVDIDTYQSLVSIAQMEERSIAWIVKRLVRSYTSESENTSKNPEKMD